VLQIYTYVQVGVKKMGSITYLFGQSVILLNRKNFSEREN